MSVGRAGPGGAGRGSVWGSGQAGHGVGVCPFPGSAGSAEERTAGLAGPGLPVLTYISRVATAAPRSALESPTRAVPLLTSLRRDMTAASATAGGAGTARRPTLRQGAH